MADKSGCLSGIPVPLEGNHQSRIFAGEEEAIELVLAHANRYGFGNLIHRLQQEWKRRLVKEWGFSDKTAECSAGITHISEDKLASIRAQVERWRDEATELIKKSPSDKDVTNEKTLLYAVTNGYRDCLILMLELIDGKEATK